MLWERLRSESLEIALAAVDAARVAPYPELQDDIAALMRDRFDQLDRAGVERILDCLDAIGDGRLVRTMEEVLAARGTQLGEHHAWRARHIVQRIRRFGRR